MLDTCIFDSTGGSGKDIAENRRIKINYPGSGNNSQFSYDGFGHRVSIIETVSGIVTSTKQFIWDEKEVKETRDASGNLLSQYFGYGQTSTGSDYFYSRDQITSIRELSTTSLQTTYVYDQYGRKLQAGSSSADFQFAGYYYHAPSGFSLLEHRTYSPTMGRFMNRDPAQEAAGSNLYRYVYNEPVSNSDPSGLQGTSITGGDPFLWILGGPLQPGPLCVPGKTISAAVPPEATPDGYEPPPGVSKCDHNHCRNLCKDSGIYADCYIGCMQGYGYNWDPKTGSWHAPFFIPPINPPDIPPLQPGEPRPPKT